ncbi:MAG TPA: hypothetical protein V6D28_31110 [Leptolyngbyaceae cyanobacterium]
MLNKFIYCAILFTIIGSGLKIATNAIAEINHHPVPTSQIITKLKNSTSVPIFIPSTLPFSDRLYFNTQGAPNNYTITFDYTADCQGATVCSIGSMEAEKSGRFITPLEGTTRTFKNIRLANEIKGVFHNGCGAYCTATVEWQKEDVLYRVSVKNGTESDAVQIANSAIQSGRR